jgi:putative transposase
LSRCCRPNQPGARPVDDRRAISGIIRVLKVGCRWEDWPSVFGPSTTIYNRFNRWSRRGLWQRLFEALVRSDATDSVIIDSTTAKAHRSAGGGKGGLDCRRSVARAAGTTKIHAVVGDKGRLIAFEITPGQLSDVRAAEALLAPLPAAPVVHRRHSLRQ